MVARLQPRVHKRSVTRRGGRCKPYLIKESERVLTDGFTYPAGGSGGTREPRKLRYEGRPAHKVRMAACGLCSRRLPSHPVLIGVVTDDLFQ